MADNEKNNQLDAQEESTVDNATSTEKKKQADVSEEIESPTAEETPSEAAATEESAPEEAAAKNTDGDIEAASNTDEKAADAEEEPPAEDTGLQSVEKKQEIKGARTETGDNGNGDGAAGSAPEEAEAPPEGLAGIAAYFDLPDELLHAAARTRDAKFDQFDAYSPFPIHGMDQAMGLSRSWIPWVTFGAGVGGFITANVLQFGTNTFDWPMIIGGKPYAPWPSFVPIMFELTVLFAGVLTGVIMLKAAGCFQRPFIIDPEITNDRFVLWISADDKKFDLKQVREFMESLNPVEIRTIKKGA